MPLGAIPQQIQKIEFDFSLNFVNMQEPDVNPTSDCSRLTDLHSNACFLSLQTLFLGSFVIRSVVFALNILNGASLFISGFNAANLASKCGF